MVRARLPRKADQVVRANRISMADPEVQVVLAGQASIKQGSLVVLGKVARGASRRTARRTANSSRKVIQSVRAST